MGYLVTIKTIKNDTGSLTVIEKDIPFLVKRVFFLSHVNGDRGKHAHKKTIHALVCVKGRCKVEVKHKNKIEVFNLSSKSRCLVLEPQDWHRMFSFSKNAILLCLASEGFDPEDYIYNHN